MVTPYAAGHPPAFQQTFKKRAPGSSEERTTAPWTAVVLIDLFGGFLNADGDYILRRRRRDRLFSRLRSSFGISTHWICGHSSPSFRDLPIVLFLELFARHVVRVWPAFARPFE